MDRIVDLPHDHYMELALIEAGKALRLNEVPIGCVIVYEGRVIGRGHNRRNTDKSCLAHAELSAIAEACADMGDWRLEDADIYVTIEPCPMCSGAILNARMKTVIFGARNPKAGCCGSILNLMDNPAFNHRVEVIEGVMQEECAGIMTGFFRGLRGTLLKLHEKENKK